MEILHIKESDINASALIKLGHVLVLFPKTAAYCVSCGGRKASLSTPFIVQIVFSVWSFEFSEGILRSH